MAEKIKKFIDCYIPITTCNLRCHYCYVTLNREFDKEIFPLKYSPEHIGKAINKERFGGICCFNETNTIKELEEEIICPEYLKEIDKDGFKHFAYPYWLFNKQIKEIVQKYYTSARSGNGFADNTNYGLDSFKVKNNFNVCNKGEK